jgi:hypothetical protein
MDILADQKVESEIDESINLLLGVMKLAADTNKNYAFRISEYLRHIDKTADEFVNEARRDPKSFFMEGEGALLPELQGAHKFTERLKAGEEIGGGDYRYRMKGKILKRFVIDETQG